MTNVKNREQWWKRTQNRPPSARFHEPGNENERNSTISKDRAWNKEDGFILEEGEIVEEEENNTEVKETSDENEELCVMGVADAEAKQRRRELEMEIEDTQNQIDNCHDDQREDLEKQMMISLI